MMPCAREGRNSRHTVATAPRSHENGIDVSNHQGSINWSKVKAAGIAFAFIKATEGQSYKDPRFADNWSGAKAAGILRGAYHFFKPDKPVAAQVTNFTSMVKLASGDLLPVLDVEKDNQNWAAMPAAKRVPLCLEFLQALEDYYKVKPLIYTSASFVSEILANVPGKLVDYPLWVASYAAKPKLPKGWTTYKYWQHSETGAVDGVATPVDLNRAADTLALSAATLLPSNTPEQARELLTAVWSECRADDIKMFPRGIDELEISVEVDPATGGLSVKVRLSGPPTKA
jgi:lysozyme